jgi:hypothetical protein
MVDAISERCSDRREKILPPGGRFLNLSFLQRPVTVTLRKEANSLSGPNLASAIGYCTAGSHMDQRSHHQTWQYTKGFHLKQVEVFLINARAEMS